MISGAHVIINSKDAEADRKFFREMFGLHSVDVGEGWLIFALPPSEVAFHPSKENDLHEFYLMSDDVKALVKMLRAKKVECSPIDEQPWGSLTHVTLPGGGKIGIYQPKHARPTNPKRDSEKTTTRPNH